MLRPYCVARFAVASIFVVRHIQSIACRQRHALRDALVGALRDVLSSYLSTGMTGSCMIPFSEQFTVLRSPCVLRFDCFDFLPISTCLMVSCGGNVGGVIQFAEHGLGGRDQKPHAPTGLSNWR